MDIRAKRAGVFMGAMVAAGDEVRTVLTHTLHSLILFYSFHLSHFFGSCSL